LYDGCIIFSFTKIHIFFSSQKEDEIEEYLRKKYADESVPMRHFGDGGEEMSDEITQQTLLPGVK
jgi:transcription elongation factor SPT5